VQRGEALETDVTVLHVTVGLDKKSAWNAANRWQCNGVIGSRISGRQRFRSKQSPNAQPCSNAGQQAS
jgi:hypothetical protein